MLMGDPVKGGHRVASNKRYNKFQYDGALAVEVKSCCSMATYMWS